MAVDYSLYLVTDSSKMILADRNLVQVVEAAILGGVTIVQYRDKCSNTRDLIRIGSRLHDVCMSYGVPLLINDRVDVALAIGAEGVHVGQDDMDIKTVRNLLAPNAIVGVTCSNPEEARVAAINGATYLGIGTMFATATKENTKAIIGPAGTREILHEVSSIGSKIPAVAIGGINASNVQHVMRESKASSKRLDGVAIVSAIIAAKDPRAAAKELRSMIQDALPCIIREISSESPLEILLRKVPLVVRAVGSVKPIAHNMTNLVVQNFAANVALCIGASPIMANNGDEAEDLADTEAGSLVINLGSVSSEGLADYVKALKAYNNRGQPVLLDPVGAGATEIRRRAVKTLLSEGYFHVIKGNETEIQTVLGETILQQKGVDSGKSELSDRDRARIVKKLALRERNVVMMTGAVDFLSDGNRTLSIHNGHHFLGSITGSGCTLGTAIASCLAVEKADTFLAAVSGIIMFTIAAEHASGSESFVAFENEKSIKAAKVKKETLSPALVEAQISEEIRSYQRKLQKVFLGQQGPAFDEDEIKSASIILGKLESHSNLKGSIIRATKVHKLLKAIIRLRSSIPKDEVFHFRTRSEELLEKWSHTLILHEQMASDPVSSGSTASDLTSFGAAASDSEAFFSTAPTDFQQIKGPGTYVPAFLDALYRIAQRTQKDDFAWLSAAQVYWENV